MLRVLRWTAVVVCGAAMTGWARGESVAGKQVRPHPEHYRALGTVYVDGPSGTYTFTGPAHLRATMLGTAQPVAAPTTAPTGAPRIQPVTAPTGAPRIQPVTAQGVQPSVCPKPPSVSTVIMPPSDEEIRASVVNLVNRWFTGKVRKLKVEVRRGNVEIDGDVPTKDLKLMIPAAIRELPGVNKVDNDLHVR